MKFLLCGLALASSASAFLLPAQSSQSLRRVNRVTELLAEEEVQSRRQMADSLLRGAAAAMIGASLFANADIARAERDYTGVAALGGGEKVDLNNANIRVYQGLKGFYPTLGAKIVKNGPYKSVGEVFSIPGLTEGEKKLLKANEARFVALEVTEAYELDKINNGLYK